MGEAIKDSILYFRAPEDYFWRWAERGAVIEWVNGVTICYRDDLLILLEQLQVKDPPPLSAVILVLAACNDNFSGSGGAGILTGIANFYKDQTFTGPETSAEVIQYHLYQALRFMDVVAALPGELRKGKHRLHLLHEIFSPGTFSMGPSPLKGMVNDLEGGNIDRLVLSSKGKQHLSGFKEELTFLSAALQKFNNTDSLVLRLRTGLNELPAAIDLFVPEERKPDLWQQLSMDSKTQGLASLARHLIAALNIPMHSHDRSDLSFGGIADITNRGNYDRLLLSELAQDNELLTARLVNNEALYFHREAPPENPRLQRTIFIDATLKMWGLPRVFAISAALACSHHLKHGGTAQAYTLYGDDYRDADLYTKEGVMSALEMLDHSLHCGKALHKALNELPRLAGNEYFFITEEQSLHAPGFHASLAQVKEQLSFLLTVGRKGDLHFYECSNGRLRVLSKAKFNLDELLFQRDNLPAMPTANETLPAFMQQRPSPLFHPVIRLKPRKDNSWFDKLTGLFTVNEMQRLLHIAGRAEGATELLDHIEKGMYAFGTDGSELAYIMVFNAERKLFKCYEIELKTKRWTTKDLPAEITEVKEMMFEGITCYIHTSDSSIVYDCGLNKIIEKEPRLKYHTLFAQLKQKLVLPSQHEMAGSSYGILFNVRSIYVSQSQKLTFGVNQLVFHSGNYISIQECRNNKDSSRHAKYQAEACQLLSNRKIKFSRWLWKDGSEAIVDSRGFLHLRSAVKTLPEITILMILGKTTACWASDGAVSGSAYFTGVNNPRLISAELFDKNYLQPFISALL